jgi:hypothetical protein
LLSYEYLVFKKSIISIKFIPTKMHLVFAGSFLVQPHHPNYPEHWIANQRCRLVSGFQRCTTNQHSHQEVIESYVGNEAPRPYCPSIVISLYPLILGLLYLLKMNMDVNSERCPCSFPAALQVEAVHPRPIISPIKAQPWTLLRFQFSVPLQLTTAVQRALATTTTVTLGPGRAAGGHQQRRKWRLCV